MEEKNIGKSQSKLVEMFEVLATVINRGVKVAKNRNSLDAVTKIVKKVNSYCTQIEGIKFSSDNRSRILNSLKIVKEAMNDLMLVKEAIMNSQPEVQPSQSL